ncbi:hypothetical protein V7O66_03395 [Methanolobus sp. ZRKC3]|uniref:hypothetical protein n=1 Tax=Methanolobus sp. ZRKC3 TaxID=3125786 RepID=UPI003249328F
MSRNYSPLSYHLGEALLSLIYTTNASLYQRTNLIALILSDVEAMLAWSDKDKSTIESIKGRVEVLRDSYEPILDDYEGVIEKRIAYEKKLDITRTELIKVIESNNLVSASMLKEIQGTKWGKDSQ